MAVEVRLVPCLTDNYSVLLRDPGSGAVAVVDVPEAEPVIAALEAAQWKPTHILVTHKHADHIQGIPAVKQRYGARVIGPRNDGSIPTLDEKVGEPDTVEVGDLRAKVFDTPGHTVGHICYWFEREKLLFAADTLFALGCGRAIEKPAAVLWASLLKLRDLPDDTVVYCGHEYTLANGRFAVTVDPNNAALKARLAAVEQARAANRPTIPSTLGEEKATNPFLRADDPSVAASVGMQGADPAAVFTEIRERKNNFRG